MQRAPLALLLCLAAGCGGDDGLMTLGEACSRISSPACDRAITCNLGPNSNKGECVEAFMEGCCKDNGNCGQTARDKDAEAAMEQYIASCSSAFSSWDCDQYGQGIAPPACRGPSSAASLPMSVLPEVLAAPERPRARELGRAAARRLVSP
jgi:hypothetical protein